MKKTLRADVVIYSLVVILTIIGTIKNISVQPIYMLIATAIGSLLLMSLFIVGAKKVNTEDILDEPYVIKEDNIFFILGWIGMFFAWLPCFLAYYPVLFNYDVINQYTQILTGEYNQHHPIVHTLLCQLFYEFGEKLNNANLGFALYSLLQMICLSGALTYGVLFLRRMHIRRWIVNVVYIWCVIFLMHPIFALSITKDTLFSVFALVAFLIILQYEFMENAYGIMQKIVSNAALLVALVGMVLFRNNAKYAIVIYVVVTVVIAIKTSLGSRKGIKVAIYWKLAIVSFLALLLAITIDTFVNNKLNSAPGNSREMLCVPMQQVARVYVDHTDELLDRLSVDDIDLLYRCCSKEYLEQYHPEYADYVKIGVNSDTIRNNRVDVIKLYLKIGVRYPLEYVRAFGDLTQGYWYLGDVSHAHIYDGWADRQGYLLTDMKPMEEINVEHESKLVFIENLYEKFATDNIQQKIPVVSMIFVPAFFILLLIISIVNMKKTATNILAVVITLAYFLTVLMGPGCVPRYSYSIIISSVFLAPVAFKKDRVNE